jgi:hypothetical protein
VALSADVPVAVLPPDVALLLHGLSPGLEQRSKNQHVLEPAAPVSYRGARRSRGR